MTDTETAVEETDTAEEMTDQEALLLLWNSFKPQPTDCRVDLQKECTDRFNKCFSKYGQPLPFPDAVCLHKKCYAAALASHEYLKTLLELPRPEILISAWEVTIVDRDKTGEGISEDIAFTLRELSLN
ncbi:hypothetical protein SEMRO_1808_G299020.1 [Seminavis robusta]|uniref:Uncharacterized protein n=1 Tax=Seminavis robusta TaxID=568900 RepID=A0A9N8EQS3_9STRA|nr:hypothetical protein SEMRO_1808_G299020.1 [Seminavis robusta]|eukprot:Sro1808_g299020.1 n/a (128) ;mRNA; r:21176-21559